MDCEVCELPLHGTEGPICALCCYEQRREERNRLLAEVEAELGLEEGEAEWPLSDGGW